MQTETTPLQLSKAINVAVNSFLALDPESEARLRPLSDRNVMVHLQHLEWFFLLSVAEDKLNIQPVSKSEVEQGEGGAPIDATISASPSTLVQLALRQDPKQRLFKNDMSIRGDVAVAQHLQDLFKRMDIDWASHLSPFLGDHLAFRVVSVGRDLKKFAGNFLQTLGLNTRDYLQEEVRLLPTPLEAEDFCAEVDTLRDDFARLNARFEQLERQIQS